MAHSIRYHLDENLHHAIATGLRRRGIDITTTSDAGLVGTTDESQLNYAIQNHRILVTSDTDFLRIHSQSEFHFGIVYIRSELSSKTGLIIRFLEQLWNDKEPSELVQQLLFVNAMK